MLSHHLPIVQTIFDNEPNHTYNRESYLGVYIRNVHSVESGASCLVQLDSCIHTFHTLNASVPSTLRSILCWVPCSFLWKNLSLCWIFLARDMCLSFWFCYTILTSNLLIIYLEHLIGFSHSLISSSISNWRRSFASTLIRSIQTRFPFFVFSCKLNIHEFFMSSIDL